MRFRTPRNVEFLAEQGKLNFRFGGMMARIPNCMSQKTRFDLTQADIPSAWYNLNADFPEPLPPPLHPGTKEPMPPEALEAIFPQKSHRAGNRRRAVDRNSRTGARHLRAVAAHAVAARGAAGKGAEHAGAHLLQIRRRQSRRQPQGQHRRARRRISTSWPARNGSPPKPARASGVRRSRSRAVCSGWNATFTWSKSVTTKSRIAGC